MLRSLQHKKYRDANKLFVVEGEKIVSELLDQGPDSPFQVREIFASPEWMEGKQSLLQGARTENTEASMAELKKVSSLVNPQPVLALVAMPENETEMKELENHPVLAFEAIRDPGNLGTIIRTADWFGIRHILCSPDSADVYNPKVIQATMGAFARVRLSYLDLEALLESPPWREKTVYGTFLDGENIYESELHTAPLIFFGNEARGLSRGLGSRIQNRLSIPSFSGQGQGSESLNVASSVAVVCSELRRR